MVMSALRLTKPRLFALGRSYFSPMTTATGPIGSDVNPALFPPRQGGLDRKLLIIKALYIYAPPAPIYAAEGGTAF
jgi:hypothetical protein